MARMIRRRQAPGALEVGGMVLLALLVMLAQVGGASPRGAPRELELGTECTGTICLDASNPSLATGTRFVFRPKSALRFSVLVRSLDFRPTLLLRSTSGDSLARLGEPWIWNDARLLVEAVAGSAFEFEVGTEDGSGGEFTISIRSGEERTPKGQDLLLARIERLQEIATRALVREDLDRAISSCLAAGNLALSESDPQAARGPLQRCLELARKHEAEPVALEARLLLALCSGLEGHHEPALTELRVLQPDIERYSRWVEPEGDEGLFWYMLLSLLHGGIADARRHLEGTGAALPHYRRAAAAAQLTDLLAIDSGRPPLMAVEACSKLTDALVELGHDAQADEALTTCEEVATDAGRGFRARAQARATRARLEGARNEVLDSHEHALEALALAGQDPEACPSLRAEILGALANSSIELAAYEEAARLLGELAALCSQHEFAEFEIPMHRARAVLAFRLQDPAAAEQEIRAALALSDALHETDGIIETRIDLGLILDSAGNRERAQREFDEAIELARANGNRRLQAVSWICAAGLHESSGQPEQAASAYTEALALGQVLQDQRLIALSETFLGRLARTRGDAQAAFSYSALAVSGFEAACRGEDALEARETLAQLALERRDAAALQSQIDAALGLWNDNPCRGLDPFRRSSRRSRFAAWGRLEQSLLELELEASHAKGAEEQALFRRGLESASRWKGRVLLEELAQGSRVPAPDTDLRYEDRALWLPADAVLLEYAQSCERLLLYVVSHAGIRRLDLGNAEALGMQAEDLARQMSSAASDVKALVHSAHATWNALLEQALSGLDDTVRTLVIVPTPRLAGLPFDALVIDPRPGSGTIPGEPRCVIDDWLVCYLPASPLLPMLRLRAPRAAGSRALIVGDAVYPGEAKDSSTLSLSVVRDTELARLGALPQSRQEALLVATGILGARPEEAAQWSARLTTEQAQRDVALRTGCFDLFLGQEAKPAVLRGDLREYSDIYLSLHALEDPRDPGRTGLVLTGSGSESGLLSVCEVGRNRNDADLVSLSACDSARGPVHDGEGVQSLASSFLMAGSRAVVAALWGIGDLDAFAVMSGFERERRSGADRDPARALRKARQEFRAGQGQRGTNGESGLRWEPQRWAWAVYFGAPPR